MTTPNNQEGIFEMFPSQLFDTSLYVRNYMLYRYILQLQMITCNFPSVSDVFFSISS